MPAKLKGITEAEVRRLYKEESMTQQQIANYFGACLSTISTYMKNYGISGIYETEEDRKKAREEVRARYNSSERGIETRRSYRLSEKCKISQKAYRQSTKGRAHKKAYESSDVRKKAKRAYFQSEAGKVCYKRRYAKRKHLGFTPINKWAEDCEGHHVDKEHVIYIPKSIHQNHYHNIWTGQGMDEMNAIALGFLEQQEVKI
jgi:predicted transcriptional regulator